MDNLRALAMLLGVFFHAAMAYSPLLFEFTPTADRESSIAVDFCIWFLHLFRMPLFFLIAGFFAAMSVAKRGMGGMFRNRLRRIALPFVIFWPLVHVSLSKITLHAAATVENPSPLLAIIRRISESHRRPEHLPGTGHLWFLYYLLFFYVLVWSARNLGSARIGHLVRRMSPTWLLGVSPLVLVPALASVGAPHPAPASFIPQFWAFGFYGPFFAFGYLLFGHEAMIERLRPIALRLLAAGVLCYGAFFHLLNRQSPTIERASASLFLALLGAYISVWMTVVCMIAGRTFLNRGNAVLRYFADASYWIYIVHLPILFAIQYRLLDVDWPWGAKFAVSVAATLGLCLLGYHALVRRTFVGDLLGGRSPGDTVQKVK